MPAPVALKSRPGGALPLGALDATQIAPVEKTRPRDAPGDPETGRKLFCRICRSVITDESQRVGIEGSHVHTRSNPAGVSFCFGCFQSAPGCAALGAATAEFSWFSGCRWQVAVCNGCGEHLGWSFKGAQRFFALILARLVADEERPH